MVRCGGGSRRWKPQRPSGAVDGAATSAWTQEADTHGVDPKLVGGEAAFGGLSSGIFSPLGFHMSDTVSEGGTGLGKLFAGNMPGLLTGTFLAGLDPTSALQSFSQQFGGGPQ